MIKDILIIFIVISFVLTWAPWLDDKEIHDRVLREKAYNDGTIALITYPNGTMRYELICDYNVMWAPYGRWVVSCEGGYYVTFWGQII